MRVRSLFAVAALAALAFASAAAADPTRSVSSDPSFVLPPTSGTPVAPPAEAFLSPIPDGGFENVPSNWTQVSNTACGNNAWILDPTVPWGIPALQGTRAWWGGGFCGGANSNSVSQVVTVPAGVRVLLFFGANYLRVDPDDGGPDIFRVYLDNTQVFQKALTEANETYPNWIPEVIDVTGWNGQTVQIKFEVTQSGFVGNVLVDFAVFIGGEYTDIPTLSPIGLAALVLALGALSFFFLRRRRTA